MPVMRMMSRRKRRKVFLRKVTLWMRTLSHEPTCSKMVGNYTVELQQNPFSVPCTCGLSDIRALHRQVLQDEGIA